MRLTKRQIRLLMISAGDHERIPKRDKDGNTVTDTKNLKDIVTKQKIPEKYMKQLRKGIKHTKKWAILGEKDIDDVEVVKQPQVKGDMKTLLDMARQSKSGVKMARSKRTPIKKKR